MVAVAASPSAAEENEEETGGDQDEGAEEEIETIECGECDRPLKRCSTTEDYFACDWAGHEGDAIVSSDDKYYYRCDTDTCNWIICKTCWDTVQKGAKGGDAEEDMSDVEVQPLGTASVRSRAYYGSVEKVRLIVDENTSIATIELFVNARGDMSDGPIDGPNSARLYIGNKDKVAVAVPLKTFKAFSTDDFQFSGILTFVLGSEELSDMILMEKVSFQYFADCDHRAVIFIPGSRYRYDCTPKCESCTEPMVIKDCVEQPYEGSFWCNICQIVGNAERWFCPGCNVDYCFNCKAAVELRPLCTNDHVMKRCNEKPSDYSGDAGCDVCGKASLSQQYYQFYHCGECKYDLCLSCAHQAAKNAASSEGQDEDVDED